MSHILICLILVPVLYEHSILKGTDCLKVGIVREEERYILMRYFCSQMYQRVLYYN